MIILVELSNISLNISKTTPSKIITTNLPQRQELEPHQWLELSLISQLPTSKSPCSENPSKDRACVKNSESRTSTANLIASLILACKHCGIFLLSAPKFKLSSVCLPLAAPNSLAASLTLLKLSLTLSTNKALRKFQWLTVPIYVSSFLNFTIRKKNS